MRSGARLLSLAFLALATVAGSPGCAGNAFSSAGGAGGTISSGGSSSGGTVGGGSGGTVNGGGSGGTRPMLADSKTLDTLTPLERAALCAELRGLVDANSDSTVYKNWHCTIQAWNKAAMASGDMRAVACQNEYQRCQATNTARLSDNVTCTDFVALDQMCATVGDLRTCYTQWAPMIQQAYDQALMGKPQNCVDAVQAGGVDMTSVTVTANVPQSCLNIVQQCM
ncbi:MAG TPA: hypothetical protein VL137_07790 [Polyangiaceae bacterium]|jgi:hypothetical protein|nr:hypothetical protein [Polyangiaceae bacterium]